MNTIAPYPIGTPGIPWGPAERSAWRSAQRRMRSYADDVLQPAGELTAFEFCRYGELASDDRSYPLVALRSGRGKADRPVILITGGVHGYETSGVAGALAFARAHAAESLEQAELVIAPCVSPWAYEHGTRWNEGALDPNRSFAPATGVAEAASLMDFVASLGSTVLCHIDLHETTDSDESEFRPALSARNGTVFEPGVVPQGFYLVADDARPELDFQKSIIDAVSAVTPIAPADAGGEIIGSPLVGKGVIAYPARPLGLCMGLSDARFVTTTEIYPDAPGTQMADCIDAQVVAIRTAITYALNHDTR